jgi:prepilin-type processing-associated H-X9-DG protein
MIPIKLQEAGLLLNPSILICPGSDLAAENTRFAIPSMSQVECALRESTGHRLWGLKCRAAGSCGFNLGIFENGNYYAPVNESRSFFVWASDAPSFHLPNRISVNHGGRGMNLLFEDGHIEFIQGYRVPGTRDDVLRSLDGLAEAGRAKNDSVIGCSIARPRSASLFWGE